MGPTQTNQKYFHPESGSKIDNFVSCVMTHINDSYLVIKVLKIRSKKYFEILN